MKYKTTYFILELNKQISISKEFLDERLSKDEIINNIEALEKDIMKIITDRINNAQILEKFTGFGGRKLKFDKAGQPLGDLFYEEYRKLNSEEHELLIQHFNINDILNWKHIESINERKIKFENIEIPENPLVKRLKSLRERLIKINEIKTRFTKKDEENLGKHLNEIASDGWKLHSMNPVIKGLFDYKCYNESGYGYGHDIQEGFVMVWEKND